MKISLSPIDLAISLVVVLLYTTLLIGIVIGKNYKQTEIEQRAATYIDKGCTTEQQDVIETIIFGKPQL